MSIPLRGLTTGVEIFMKKVAGENSLIRTVNLKIEELEWDAEDELSYRRGAYVYF